MICIVGGGPAGLATSIALAQAGFRVKVVDCATPPIDKACGEGLLPDSLDALTKLGVRIPAGAGHPFSGIRFVDGRFSVGARFPGGPALGLRRTVLHDLLVERALRLNVDLEWGVRTEGHGSWDLLVGADGGSSGIRRRAGLDEGANASHRFGFRRHYRLAPWSELMEVHWSRRVQIYVTPIAADEVGVAVVSRDSKLRVDDALLGFPELRERLRQAVPVSSERGSLSTMRQLRQVWRDRVVLVGDASGSVDVITGEGLGLGFRQALALATALREGGLPQYARAHRALSRRPRLMAQLLLALGASAPLRKPAFAGMRLCPHIFSSLLAFHVGA